MSGALVIAGAIFFLASWTTPSEKDADQFFAMALAVASLGAGLAIWVLA